MSTFHILQWCFTAAFIYGIYKLVRGLFPGTSTTLFCSTCGHEGPTSRKTKGGLLIEIVLWCFFIVPGLVYSLWRLNSRHNVCAKCGSTALVPVDSPVARAFKEPRSRVV